MCLVTEDGVRTLLGKVVLIIVILIVSVIVARIVRSLLNTWIKRKLKHSHDPGRVKTIGQMTKAVSKVGVYFIAIMLVLSVLEVNTASIIATAGIGSLAIGFGAQSLVKDIITGFFILWENQYAVGDLIVTEGYQGYVEELGIRITKLRDFDGTLHIIPNGTITTVSNQSRGPIRAWVQIKIALDEDIERAIEILQEAVTEYGEQHDYIIDKPIVQGVSNLGEFYAELQIYSTTKPDYQWSVERDLRRVAREAFNKNNIEIPHPHMEVVKEN